MKSFNINLAKTKKGVSIIELLIVISVIGILASTVSVVSRGTQKSAQDAKRKEDAELILNALTAYAAKHGGSLRDIVGTYPTCTSMAAPVDTDSVVGNDACQANFYSTPTPPNSGPPLPGRNRWSDLETYLQPYVGSALPVDPKNKNTSWISNQNPNLSNSDFRNGFYIVSMIDREVTQQLGMPFYGCTGGPTLTLSYGFTTAFEDTKDPLSYGARYPLLNTSSTICRNFRTLFGVGR